MTTEKIPEYITVTEASRATGLDRKTIRKRIDQLVINHTDGLHQFYPTIEVLKNCFLKATEAETSELNLTQEKAKYYRELTEKIRLEKEKLADKLLDAEQLEIEQTKVRLAFKEKLLNLSAKLGPRLSRMKNTEKIIELLETCHKEILAELGEANEHIIGEDQRENKSPSKRDEQSISPTSDLDGE